MPLCRRADLVNVQFLVLIFLCINVLLIVTICSKAHFYTTMRYMLFGVTVLSDSLILIMSDILVILNHFNVTMNIAFCVCIYITLVVFTFVTPVTLTAMTLERYVAICKPLRHGELLSSVPCIIVLSNFFATAPFSLYSQHRLCLIGIFVLLRWQDDVKLVVYQCYFLIMSATICFSYVKIMKVAKDASGEDKKSTRRGLRTLVLHSFQLLLCLIQLWCPFIENAVLQINFKLYVEIRFFDYIMFYLAPRCLSPLIYGLRDKKVSLALKQNALFGFHRPNVQNSI
uniref:G-protein coupled receptors family 1 profile domain-containing protein n=1 Tax=Scophthalmus maximus TaxID=52904 RepID=A0A8D3E9J2_SCOMX